MNIFTIFSNFFESPVVVKQGYASGPIRVDKIWLTLQIQEHIPQMMVMVVEVAQLLLIDIGAEKTSIPLGELVDGTV